MKFLSQAMDMPLAVMMAPPQAGIPTSWINIRMLSSAGLINTLLVCTLPYHIRHWQSIWTNTSLDKIAVMEKRTFPFRRASKFYRL